MENQILLEKIGETKTDKLINDCNKIYMENFRKEYPNYFESNYLKSITKVITTPKDSNEISGIGMSCMNDLLVKNFAQFLGGFLGSSRVTVPDQPRRTNGQEFTWGFIKSGAGTAYFGRSLFAGTGISITVGSSFVVPQKTDFSASNGVGGARGLIVNAGTFSAGLNTVTWSAGNSSVQDFDISSSNVTANWQLSGQGFPVLTWLILSDLISPVVPVLIGEGIFLEITFQFS